MKIHKNVEFLCKILTIFTIRMYITPDISLFQANKFKTQIFQHFFTCFHLLLIARF